MQKNPQLDPIEVFSSETLRCLCYNPNARHLVVSMDHRRIRRGDFPQPHYPARFHERAFLLVHCISNNWFLSKDTNAMRRSLKQFCAGFETANILGSSMGGYGALLFAEEFKATNLLLVSPQFSIFPEYVPFDQRFEKFARNLDINLDQVAKVKPHFCKGVLIYDPGIREDRLHKNTICAHFPDIKSLAFSFSGHPALSLVSKENLFGHVMKELLRPELSRANLRALHTTARRRSDDYLNARLDYLAARANRISKP